MDLKLRSCGLSKARIITTAVCCLFALASMMFVHKNSGETFSYFYCLVTIPFVCLPALGGVLFKWRFNLGFYIVFSLYALGPLLGAVYTLYYITPWWDDLLHALAGTLFAVVGGYLAVVLNREGRTSCLLAALFGLLFTMGIAVLWEFFEYGADLLLGSDMQADTVVHYIATKLGRTDGGVSVFQNIEEVLINGEPLGLGGYVDIGLTDTMTDMAVETAGGLVYLVYALIDRDRHPLICKATDSRR